MFLCDTMVGVVSGTCCYEHSNFNMKKSLRCGLVEETLIPWMVYAMSMRERQPDWIIDECTPDTVFMVRQLQKWLGAHWSIATWFLEPRDFGSPSSGQRRFSLLMNEARRFWNTPPPSPLDLFGASCELTAEAFYAAPDVVVQGALEAARRALDFSPQDSSVTWRETLPCHHYQRLLAAEKEFQSGRLSIGDAHCLIYMSDQNVQFGFRTSSHSPRLLRRSSPWNFSLDRPQLKWEVLMQMGMPALEEPWISFLETVEHDVRQEIAGNALHPTVFAAVFLCMLLAAGDMQP